MAALSLFDAIWSFTVTNKSNTRVTWYHPRAILYHPDIVKILGSKSILWFEVGHQMVLHWAWKLLWAEITQSDTIFFKLLSVNFCSLESGWVSNVISPLFKGKGEKFSVPMGPMRRGPTVLPKFKKSYGYDVQYKFQDMIHGCRRRWVHHVHGCGKGRSWKSSCSWIRSYSRLQNGKFISLTA